MESIQIIDYLPIHQPYFERFNRNWIEHYFWMEEMDREVLQNPNESIIQKGGFILMALYRNKVVGTVAMKRISDQVFELTKMVVDSQFRKLGIGENLCCDALERAKNLGAISTILFSNTVLESAIRLYKKLGFKEIYLQPGIYQRANIKMRKKL